MPQRWYIPWVPKPNSIKRIGVIHRYVYQATAGLIGSRLDGLDILLLTTIGRKSGEQRCVPLPYFRSGERILLAASYGGGPSNPAWFANLLAQPEVRVQLGRQIWTTRARVPEGAERAQLWAEITREFPRYAVYQGKTSREIPVVVLDRPA